MPKPTDSPAPQPSPAEGTNQPAEERRVAEALEQAQQSVKALVKREREAERLSEEILNFRLR